MAAARGDRKPCTQPRCAGTMQFGRELSRTQSELSVEGQRGWVCSAEPGHFLLESPPTKPAGTDALDACWDEQGAPRAQPRAT